MARGWGDLRNSTVFVRNSIFVVSFVGFGGFQPMATLLDVSYSLAKLG